MSALVRARGQIMFLIGLVLASAVVFWLNGLESVPASDVEPASSLVYMPPAEIRASWNWFERNKDEKTGLLLSGQDTGHLLRATLAAHRLGLINGRELYHRLHRSLETLDGRAPAADPVLVSALELIAWSYPANSGEALRLLANLRGAGTQTNTIATLPAARPSAAARHADVLVGAAIQKRGKR